eukprot:Hpha_TRINITY_DN23177_c0_g1::TRINITY_DN23177_c0_g1_i1::g.29620::m.29620
MPPQTIRPGCRVLVAGEGSAEVVRSGSEEVGDGGRWWWLRLKSEKKKWFKKSGELVLRPEEIICIDEPGAVPPMLHAAPPVSPPPQHPPPPEPHHPPHTLPVCSPQSPPPPHPIPVQPPGLSQTEGSPQFVPQCPAAGQTPETPPASPALPECAPGQLMSVEQQIQMTAAMQQTLAAMQALMQQQMQHPQLQQQQQWQMQSPQQHTPPHPAPSTPDPSGEHQSAVRFEMSGRQRLAEQLQHSEGTGVPRTGMRAALDAQRVRQEAAVQARLVEFLGETPIGRPGESGSTSARHFDATPIARFAIQCGLHEAPAEEIYGRYVQHQME